MRENSGDDLDPWSNIDERLEDDEISVFEQCFMQGWLGGEV